MGKLTGSGSGLSLCPRFSGLPCLCNREQLSARGGLTTPTLSLLGLGHSSPKSTAQFFLLLKTATQCSEICFSESLLCKFIHI